jgi:hypothetical protein
MAYIGNSPERPTASGILDSIKTVDGTASGLDADTLDGKQLATIESEYQAFANTAAANVVDSAPGTLDTLNELAAALGDDANFSTTVTNSISTKLPLAGGTMTGDVSFGDTKKAIFGAGSDLQIYHDGGNSHIKEEGSGILFISGSSEIQLRTATDEVYIQCIENSGVNLRHDNSQKLSTTSTGIDVTGTAEVDTLKFSDNTTQTSAGASTGKAIAMAIVFGG